jgi:hypothetical protein
MSAHLHVDVWEKGYGIVGFAMLHDAVEKKWDFLSTLHESHRSVNNVSLERH